MSKCHQEHPEYPQLGAFAGYGEFDENEFQKDGREVRGTSKENGRKDNTLRAHRQRGARR